MLPDFHRIFLHRSKSSPGILTVRTLSTLKLTGFSGHTAIQASAMRGARISSCPNCFALSGHFNLCATAFASLTLIFSEPGSTRPCNNSRACTCAVFNSHVHVRQYKQLLTICLAVMVKCIFLCDMAAQIYCTKQSVCRQTSMHHLQRTFSPAS
jgi:hypothetical protein